MNPMLGLPILFAIIAVAVVALIVVGVVIKGIIRGKGRNTQSPKICPQCGKPLKDGKSFCTNCGAKAEC